MYYFNQFNQLFNSQFSKESLSSAWLLVGDEPVLIDESLKKLTDLAEKKGANKIYFTPEKKFDFSFLEEASISGLFDERNCYIFRFSAFSFSKKQLDSIQYFLEKNTNHSVIFLYDEFRAADRNKTIVKLFEDYGFVVRHMKIKEAAYRSWVQQKLLSQKIKLSNHTVDLMVHYTQGNPAHIVQLVEKIRLLDDKNSLDDRVIDLLEEANLCSVFDFLDSLYQRKPKISLKKLDALIKSGENLIKIIFLLDREIRMVLNFLSSKSSSGADSVIKRDFIFPAKKLIIERYLRYRSKQELLSASMLIGKIDRSSKGMNNASLRNEMNKLVCLLTQ